ncbi:GumC family protein [Croceicoccus gelatinilyticus]|uniref:GumC family protein n=1 Tax=Croceicoccus gelatinilyticus TaxID=2835536 RepID=UPI001BCCD65B|nr:polysaccharide biosynthesis tyrosine autokinase [Croceicoccus gelatinilyticus]MBS7668930.1 polysaccharide biosynthesis tyrosine autokinase [Croceicoccus gelatinilyticus]
MNRMANFAQGTAISDTQGGDRIDAAPVIDLQRFWGVLWHNRVLIGAVVVGCLLAGLAMTLMLTPRYTAVSSLQIDQESRQIMGEENASREAYRDADRFLQTHVDVLNSRRMAERVAQEMDLLGDPQAFFDRMHVSAATDGPDARAEARRELVLQTIEDSVEVTLPSGSRVVQIAFTSPDADFAAQMANAYAESYARYNVDRRLEATVYARDFLGRQLAEARDRLESAEREANDYARAVGLVRTVGGGDETSLTDFDLTSYNAALGEARNERIAAQSKWQLVANADAGAIAEAIENRAMQDLVASRAQVQATLEAELADKQAGHPAVAPLRQRVREYDAQIATLAEGIRTSIRDSYRMAASREQELQGRVDMLKGATQRERDDAVQFNTLMREVDTSRQLYDGLLARFRQTSAEANITANNVQQIDRASPPVKPSSPRLLLNLALAAVTGLLIAGVAVALREQGHNAVRTPGEIEDRLGLRLLGITPKVGRGGMDHALDQPGEPLHEALVSLRTALQFALPSGGSQRLLVTSAEPGEGKSSTAYGIARAFAEGGRRTLIVDCDLRRPALHDMLGLAAEPGLSGVLASGDAASAIVAGPVANLSVLPSGAVPAVPTDLLGSPEFAQLMGKFERDFDIIVLDGPPVLGLADVPVLASGKDVATLFVVEAGRTDVEAARNALSRLAAGSARIVGGVMAKFDFAEARRLGLGRQYGDGQAYYRYGG